MTKQIESTADSGRTIQGLVMEANDLAFGVEHLAENFELSPLRQQALTEAVSLIDRVVSTLEAVR